MASQVFNIGKGRTVHQMLRVTDQNPAASRIVVVLLKSAESDSGLLDRNSLNDILTGSTANQEADFTNYTRKVLGSTSLTAPTPDDTNNVQTADLPDLTWTSAGGATNNTLAKLLVCYTPSTASTGGDSDYLPLTHHDYVDTTDGSDLTALFGADGFFRSN